MRPPPPHILKNFPSVPRHPRWAEVSAEKWNDWIWQQQNRVKTLAVLKEVLSLSPAEEEAFTQAEKNFRIAITPYYLSLMNRQDPACPIRRQAVPQPGELTALNTELADPSGEDGMSPAPGIVHRYPDRVLLYTTHNCAVYCRFCTRKRKVSDPGSAMLTDEIEAGIDYIRRTPTIRDVVVSGGDALSNSDDRLANILEKLRAIPHVQILRVGSRNLVTLPQRITPAFAKMLAEFAPVYVHTHFNHPTECSRDAFEACKVLADAGIPLNNHTVLLKGINDSAETIRDLNHKLLMMRVRPYYLYQCDQVFGNSAFRTSVRKGLEVIQGLRGWTSGLAVPHFVVDTPGGGKVPLLPDYVVEEKGDVWRLRNYKGEEFTYVQGGE